MHKIFISITNNKKAEILEELKKSDLNLSEIDIVEHKRDSKFGMAIKFGLFKIKSKFQIIYRNAKELIKYKKIEPRFGGGMKFDPETFYGAIFTLFKLIIVPGLCWDIIKTIIIKSYKHLTSPNSKVDYIEIESTIRQPFDCRVKILIPNNLDEEYLERALYQANEIFVNLDNVRNYFGKSKIIVKYICDYRWDIKLK